jgi:hypothetical protein
MFLSSHASTSATSWHDSRRTVESEYLTAGYRNAIRTLMQVPYESSRVYTPRSFLDTHCNSTIRDAQRYQYARYLLIKVYTFLDQPHHERYSFFYTRYPRGRRQMTASKRLPSWQTQEQGMRKHSLDIRKAAALSSAKANHT